MVDLRSDTVTRPDTGMLTAMMRAEVGDDVLGDDPTVKQLEAVAAQLTGKEAALFTPSGTMANQIAIRGWTQPGDELLMYDGGHPYNYEAGAAATISGVQVRPLPAARGLLDPEVVWAHVRPPNDHFAPATLLMVENTSNRGGGSVYPLDTLAALYEGARTRGLAVHLDGARVFNAAAALGVPLKQITAHCDSVCFCLSKGLGAPVGSVLAGSAAWIARARRIRKMLGGGMRQSGYLAAAGLYALEHNPPRLVDDHRRARRLYEGLVEMGFSATEPETNMVYVTVPRAAEAEAALAARGVACIAVGPELIRLVTHLDVDDAGISSALAGFALLRPART
ncbi:MAG: low-specificity L-threonine aldolase [Alphaproteobacteria bacterium]|nr:low-specificity L-threonine aldolase [Alphaproteobacteria bacterium]